MKKLPRVLLKLRDEDIKQAERNARKGGFCCPGCGSDDIITHHYQCRAAVVAGVYGVDLLTMAKMLKGWKETREALRALLHADNFDELETVRQLPKSGFVKLTVTAEDMRRIARLAAEMGVV